MYFLLLSQFHIFTDFHTHDDYYALMLTDNHVSDSSFENTSFM